MAIVRKLYESPTDGGPHPSQVDASWAKIIWDGGVMIQISTYGSDTRVSKPKVSQTLQFDRERAGELVAALRAVFGDI